MALTMAVWPATAADFKVIVNASNERRQISKKELANIFLKKIKAWEDGSPIVVVEQELTRPVRAGFTSAVHGKSLSAIKSFWWQQVFSGRDVPPVEKPSDREIVAFVKGNPGAIGYIDAASDSSGVKVISVE
jgi:ABC-type phosphate transport system substrate-binding protein